jgi:hypothetical protein
MSNTTTAIVMAIFAVAFIGVDVYLALDKRDGNTYSERLRAWAKVWPPLRLVIAFVMGMLCGHWWWT